MDEPATCGEGLAWSAALPQKTGELTQALGLILELHRETLDLADGDARIEDEAYAELAKRHREIGASLLALAERMTAQRTLPMGRHIESAFDDPRHAAALRRFVDIEADLVSMLQDRLMSDREMLQMFAKDEIS